MTEPLVTNASSKKQVKAAHAKELRGRDREIEDVRHVLRTKEGRRFYWRLMAKCKSFESILHPSGSMLYYQAGQQDIGHFLLGELVATDENKLIEMMIEAKEFENG